MPGKKQFDLPLTHREGASVFFPHGNLFFPIFCTAQIFFTPDGLLSVRPAAWHYTSGSNIDACGTICRAAMGLRKQANRSDPVNFLKKMLRFCNLCDRLALYLKDKNKKVINRAVALTRYFNECRKLCYDVSVDPVYYDELEGILIVEIQDDGNAFNPVNKNPEEDDPGKNHHGVEVDK